MCDPECIDIPLGSDGAPHAFRWRSGGAAGCPLHHRAGRGDGAAAISGAAIATHEGPDKQRSCDSKGMSLTIYMSIYIYI